MFKTSHSTNRFCGFFGLGQILIRKKINGTGTCNAHAHRYMRMCNWYRDIQRACAADTGTSCALAWVVNEHSVLMTEYRRL